MAKKTKKEKLIAEYRRKLSQIANPVISVNPAPINFKPRSNITNTSSLALPDNELLAIKKDLLMTVILALGAFVLQIVVWKVVG